MIFSKSSKKTKVYTEEELIALNCAAQESDKQETCMRKELRAHGAEDEFFTEDSKYFKLSKTTVARTAVTLVVAVLGTAATFYTDTKSSISDIRQQVEELRKDHEEHVDSTDKIGDKVKENDKRILWLEWQAKGGK